MAKFEIGACYDTAVWESANGRRIPISVMTRTHIANSCLLLSRKQSIAGYEIHISDAAREWWLHAFALEIERRDADFPLLCLEPSMCFSDNFYSFGFQTRSGHVFAFFSPVSESLIRFNPQYVCDHFTFGHVNSVTGERTWHQ